MRNIFIAPVIVSLVALLIVYIWGGPAALLLAATLAVLEVTLSFDNAVVNAKVLAKMTPRWQKRFLTWGMLISVIGVRLILPVLIVSIVLLYFFDGEKEVHWIRAVERRFARWGQIEAISIGVALVALVLTAALATVPALLVIKSGVVGAILFILTEGLTDALGSETKSAVRAGFALFIYINVLDAAFSLDNVVAAFALTTLVPIIVVGLGIGAYFVRALTLTLVRGGTLKKLIYLEHGAHWAIFALSVCMLASLVTPVPEWFIASIGLVLIVLSYFSSRRELRRA